MMFAIFGSCIQQKAILSNGTVRMGAASSKVSETDDVDNPACMPTPSEKHVENPVFMPKQSEKHVENPAFIPTPAEKLKAYEAVIVSLNLGLEFRFPEWLTMDIGVSSTGSPRRA